MGTKNNPGNFDCYANADPDEPMFILLGRDTNAPQLVQEWAEMREAAGEDRAKTEEARDCADAMIDWLEKLGKKPVFVATEMIEKLAVFWKEHNSRLNTIIGKATVPSMRTEDPLAKEVHLDLINFANWVDEQLAGMNAGTDDD